VKKLSEINKDEALPISAEILSDTFYFRCYDMTSVWSDRQVWKKLSCETPQQEKQGVALYEYPARVIHQPPFVADPDCGHGHVAGVGLADAKADT
jgi:hypothetical protein